MTSRMWRPPERIRYEATRGRMPTRAEAAASRLFSPVRIGSLTLEQRSWVPAMVPWRATEDGFVTDDVIDWYRRFAAGRPGVIVVEATGIRDIPSGPLLRVGHERFVPGLARLCQAVRDASGGETRLFLQIIDFLRVKRRPPKDRFFADFLALEPRHRESLAALRGDPAWLGADDDSVRAQLCAMEDDELAAVLSNREMDDYLYG